MSHTSLAAKTQRLRPASSRVACEPGVFKFTATLHWPRSFTSLLRCVGSEGRILSTEHDLLSRSACRNPCLSSGFVTNTCTTRLAGELAKPSRQKRTLLSAAIRPHSKRALHVHASLRRNLSLSPFSATWPAASSEGHSQAM